MTDGIVLYRRERQPNPRFPHHCIIRRLVDTDDPMADETEKRVIYDGECRSYDFHTTSSAGDVLVSNRKLSIPLRQQDFGEDQPLPVEGDEVEVSKYGTTEYGVVMDKMPGNLGTHILWRYGRT